jgi:hypothetical protein
MNWTFGIITGGQQENNINQIIDSIELEQIPNYEIIIIGSCNTNRNNTMILPFDETIKSKWITRKKNIISAASRFNNICYLHDYVMLNPGWYDNFVKFGDYWDVCMNKIINFDGTRFRDWVLWYPKFVNYNDTSQIKKMYVSGTYFCAKKQFMLKNKLNENLCWGQGEDVEWSIRVRNFWNYKCNPNSSVRFLQQKLDHTHLEG